MKRQSSQPLKRYGKKAKYVIYAENGLVPDKVWGPKLRGYPTSLVCLIRAALADRVPGISEKFNSNSRYFGYRVGMDKDRAYIYVQKKKLVIDLCISPIFTKELRHLGFEVKPRDNFQGKAGWLTGWEVPKSTLNLEPVVKYLCKAFEG
jgi:hypothetical protein